MVTNTSIIAAGVSYTAGLIAHPRWAVRPAIKGDRDSEAAAELVESCLYDLSLPWSRVVRRAYMYKFYGFGVQEWTAKKRPDGRVGLASILPRPQSTIERWSTDDSGRVDGVFQRSNTTGELLGLPRSKIMYLVEDMLLDSPEGQGVFRMLAEPWERLKAYYDLEARAFERDLRGIPVGRIPYTAINAAVKDGTLTEAQATSMVKAMEDFVQIAIKQSNTGITIDSAPYLSQAADGDKVAGINQWDLSLLQGSGNGMADIDRAITRTQMEMARIMACQHLLLGDQSGNRALSKDMSQNLYLMANATLTDITAGVDADIVGPICLLNNIADEHRPYCEVEDVAFKDAETVASVLSKMAQAGAVLAPNDPVVEDVRELLGVSVPTTISPELAGLSSGPPTDDELLDKGEDDEGGTSAAKLTEARLVADDSVLVKVQARVPAGSSDGGQFSSAGGSGGSGGSGGEPGGSVAQARSYQDASEKDQRVLSSYFENAYGLKLNAHLRGQQVSGNREKIAQDAKNLVAAFDRNAKPLGGNAVVYRGVKGDAWSGLKVGDNFSDAGFASASSSKAWAKVFAGKSDGVLLEVRAPKGTKVLGGVKGSKEQEVVFGPKTNFRVVSRAGNNMVVEVVKGFVKDYEAAEEDDGEGEEDLTTKFYDWFEEAADAGLSTEDMLANLSTWENALTKDAGAADELMALREWLEDVV